MDISAKNILFVIFMIWGFPLGYYRSKFRKIIYQTDSWTINIKPIFWKELTDPIYDIHKDLLYTILLQISKMQFQMVETCENPLYIIELLDNIHNIAFVN